MGGSVAVGDASSWTGKPARSPQRLRRAEREDLRRAQVISELAGDSTRHGIEAEGMRAQALDACGRFAISSITDRTMQARQEAESSGLADDVSFLMNQDIILRGLAMGYNRIANRIAGNSW